MIGRGAASESGFEPATQLKLLSDTLKNARRPNRRIIGRKLDFQEDRIREGFAVPRVLRSVPLVPFFHGAQAKKKLPKSARK